MLGVMFPDTAIFPMLYTLLAAWIVLLGVYVVGDVTTRSWALMRDHGGMLGGRHGHHPRPF